MSKKSRFNTGKDSFDFEEERFWCDIGKTLLIEDYLLKQLSSSLTDPHTSYGKKYWQEVHKIAARLANTKNIPLDTFNKIWIVPDTTPSDIMDSPTPSFL